MIVTAYVHRPTITARVSIGGRKVEVVNSSPTKVQAYISTRPVNVVINGDIGLVQRVEDLENNSYVETLNKDW